VTAADPQLRVSELLGTGFAALADGRWDEGRRSFLAALEFGDLPEALEGLGLSAYFVDDIPVLFESRERAYLLYRERGDRLAAARLAAMLANDYGLFKGEDAVANGWLQRAHRLLKDVELSVEHGMLKGMEGFLALQLFHDLATAKRASAEILTLAQALDSTDLEVAALAIEGLALVREGQIDRGMSLLDEAMTAALAGEVQSLDLVITAFCFLICACENVRDLDRATQWCGKLAEFCRRFDYRAMLAYCRTHHAAVLIWRGEWSEADAELAKAIGYLSTTRVGLAAEGLLRLADLRRRQGRFDETRQLFDQVAGHAFATLGRAWLAFDAGDIAAAGDLVERFLRQVPPGDLMERIDGLELSLRISCALGHIDEARATLAELESAAQAAGTPPFWGMVSSSRGHLAAAEGDLESARRNFEDAVDCFSRSRAPFESAKASVELARILVAEDRAQQAALEARRAYEIFHGLGAVREEARALTILREVGTSVTPERAAKQFPAGLTRREAEVLSLLASGLSNQEIARDLFLSVRTVERHISTVYAKIGAEGSSARAVATAYAFTHGFSPALTS
jgi:ATP/maltotriose-dependent transcriptional regulator MalT